MSILYRFNLDKLYWIKKLWRRHSRKVLYEKTVGKSWIETVESNIEYSIATQEITQRRFFGETFRRDSLGNIRWKECNVFLLASSKKIFISYFGHIKSIPVQSQIVSTQVQTLTNSMIILNLTKILAKSLTVSYTSKLQSSSRIHLRCFPVITIPTRNYHGSLQFHQITILITRRCFKNVILAYYDHSGLDCGYRILLKMANRCQLST